MGTSYDAVMARVEFALTRAAAWPLSETPVRLNGWRYRLWLAVMDARYTAAVRAVGRERAARWDYIPF